MTSQNTSDVPDELFALIERYVRARCQRSKTSALMVTRSIDPCDFASTHNCITGVAKRMGGWLREMPEKHLVAVVVPGSLFTKQYPDSFVTEGMEVEVLSWDEELVLVLGHEFRHIWQYETGNHTGREQDPADELDAEVFGAKLLEQYRPWRNRYFTKTAARVAARRAA